jgi:hypothetical protein
MDSQSNHWTKEELKTYVLLLCADADTIKSENEINLIKSKTDSETFEKMSQEFANDSDEESLEKIDVAIQWLEYTEMELAEFRKEIHQLFLTDKNLDRREKNLDRILDNILY